SRHLHHFPTRRSSDLVDYVYASYQAGRIKRVLVVCPLAVVGVWVDEIKANCPQRLSERHAAVNIFSRNDWDRLSRVVEVVWKVRSEEHTSELQSRENL